MNKENNKNEFSYNSTDVDNINTNSNTNNTNGSFNNNANEGIKLDKNALKSQLENYKEGLELRNNQITEYINKIEIIADEDVDKALEAFQEILSKGATVRPNNSSNDEEFDDNSNNANTNNNSPSDLADIENKLDENAKAALDTINIIQEESIKGEALKIISDLSNRANELENEVANKIEEIVDFSSHIQRLQADFDNFKRNADKEKAALTKFANEELIVKIIDSYEDMNRALKNSKNEVELRGGLELIYSKLQKTLEKEGLAEIPAEGEKFDHNKHEALMVEDSDDFKDGDIMDEIIKGYTLKDKVIKYSKVCVCKKKN